MDRFDKNKVEREKLDVEYGILRGIASENIKNLQQSMRRILFILKRN